MLVRGAKRIGDPAPRRMCQRANVSSSTTDNRRGSAPLTCAPDPLPARLAVLLGAVASGETRICGLPQTAELAALLDTMRLFGAQHRTAGDDILVCGTGNGCLLEPEGPVRFEHDPESACLVAGLVAAHDMPVRIEAGSALASDVFETVAAPLRRMGTQIDLETGSAAMVLHGPRAANPVDMTGMDLPPVAFATVLLAGLNVAGEIGVGGVDAPVIELFRAFGAKLRAAANGRAGVVLRGQGLLAGTTVRFS